MGSIRRWCQVSKGKSHFGKHTLFIVLCSRFLVARLGIKNGELAKNGEGAACGEIFAFLGWERVFLLAIYV